MSKHIVFIELSLTGAGEKAVNYALSRNYSVTVVTKNPDNYKAVLPAAVRLYECDTNDNQKFISSIKLLDHDYKVDGITTTADFYVPQAALGAETLGLISMKYESALRARNKYLMREELQKHCEHLNPPFSLVKTTEQAKHKANEWGYPVIAKPQDANDSFNVKLIKNEDELMNYMDEAQSWMFNAAGQYTPAGILLEGYIEGEEYSVETVQHKFQPIELIGVTGKSLVGLETGHFVEAGVFFPIKDDISEKLYREVAKALELLGIDCGVIHTECRVHNGEVKILEINPRLMGDMAGSHMIEASLGADPIEQVVEIALGHSVPWTPRFTKGAAMYGSMMPRTGVFKGIENINEIQGFPGVCAVKVMGVVDEVYTYPPVSNGDMILRLVTKGDSPEEALILAQKAAKAVKVNVGDSRGTD